MNLTPATAANLLAKFYDGLTDCEEERQLRRFLEADDCPREMLPDRAVLALLAEPLEVVPPAGFEARLAQLRPRMLPRWHRLSAGVAAAVAALILSVPLTRHFTADIYVDTCSSPQEAAAEVNRTLDFMARSLSSGLAGDYDEIGAPCP